MATKPRDPDTTLQDDADAEVPAPTRAPAPASHRPGLPARTTPPPAVPSIGRAAITGWSSAPAASIVRPAPAN